MTKHRLTRHRFGGQGQTIGTYPTFRDADRAYSRHPDVPGSYIRITCTLCGIKHEDPEHPHRNG